MSTKIRQFDPYSENWYSIMAIGQKTAIAIGMDTEFINPDQICGHSYEVIEQTYKDDKLKR